MQLTARQKQSASPEHTKRRLPHFHKDYTANRNHCQAVRRHIVEKRTIGIGDARPPSGGSETPCAQRLMHFLVGISRTFLLICIFRFVYHNSQSFSYAQKLYTVSTGLSTGKNPHATVAYAAYFLFSPRAADELLFFVKVRSIIYITLYPAYVYPQLFEKKAAGFTWNPAANIPHPPAWWRRR